jgi:hypothetical protein
LCVAGVAPARDEGILPSCFFFPFFRCFHRKEKQTKERKQKKKHAGGTPAVRADKMSATRKGETPSPRRSHNMLVLSCHADTGFDFHRLERLANGLLRGRLDNFAGVYAVMKAYFSGRLTFDFVRIELTYGEETGNYDGAREVVETLNPHDVVIVVDVTGSLTHSDLSIEKCPDPAVQEFLREALAGLSYDLHAGCPDPISDCDETDVYLGRCRRTFFLGVPVAGGDYNAGDVTCREKTIEAAAEAICRIAERFSDFCRREGIPVH